MQPTFQEMTVFNTHEILSDCLEQSSYVFFAASISPSLLHCTMGCSNDFFYSKRLHKINIQYLEVRTTLTTLAGGCTCSDFHATFCKSCFSV